MFVDDEFSKMVRYYIITKSDRHHKNVLHLAAQANDKHFTTMLVHEADLLGFSGEIIDKKDIYGLTALFYLAIEGYRKERGEN